MMNTLLLSLKKTFLFIIFPIRWLVASVTGWFANNFWALMFVTLFVGSAAVVLWKRVVVTIPTGSVGVVYRPFWNGLSMDTVLPEGLNLMFPLDVVTTYDARVQTQNITMEVLTQDQLKSTVKVSFQYQINQLTLPLLHKFVGPDFFAKIILPAVTSKTRVMFANVASHEAFTKKIEMVTNEIAITSDQIILDKLSPPGLDSVRLVRISSVQLESMSFPADIESAIQSKLVEAQISEGYVHKLEIARKEAERKAIEAGGVKHYQEIVNQGLTDQYLKLRGIEATLKLAESNNSKVVVFGSSSNGLPVILNTDNTPNTSGLSQQPTPTSPVATPKK
jgi:regulator of protease activity HflC (stomatin/prohibitin superfamily)